MPQEVELKLLVPDSALAIFEQNVLAELSASVDKAELQLLNHYFDTPKRSLRKHNMGFRVRATNGEYEQTIKTAGNTLGGLHQRPEYNIALDNDQPDLTQFSPELFPPELDVTQLQSELQLLFTTHFLRTRYLLSFDDGTQVELAIDQGFVQADKQQSPICELELELKHGETAQLFDLADKLAKHIDIRIGNLSKAARGYQLLDGNLHKVKGLPAVIPLQEDASLEQAFCSGINHLLSHWQQQEVFYAQSQKPKALWQILQCKVLLAHLFAVCSPLMQCAQLSELTEALNVDLAKWGWLESARAIKELRSSKSNYSRGLVKQDALLSYLRGRYEGLLAEHQPQALLDDKANHLLQLNLARLIYQKPWRETSQSHEFTQPTIGFARLLIDQAWQAVQPALVAPAKLTETDYLAHRNLLQTSLHSGFLLGAVFPAERSDFRAPWLDILQGIEELYTLDLLQKELPLADVKDEQDIANWSQEKMKNLVSVMEKSRAVAKQMQPYW